MCDQLIQVTDDINLYGSGSLFVQDCWPILRDPSLGPPEVVNEFCMLPTNSALYEQTCRQFIVDSQVSNALDFQKYILLESTNGVLPISGPGSNSNGTTLLQTELTFGEKIIVRASGRTFAYAAVSQIVLKEIGVSTFALQIGLAEVSGLFVSRLESGQAFERVPAPEPVNGETQSPQGFAVARNLVFYTAYVENVGALYGQNGQVFSYHADTGTVTECMVPIELSKFDLIREIAFSPDGNWAVFRAYTVSAGNTWRVYRASVTYTDVAATLTVDANSWDLGGVVLNILSTPRTYPLDLATLFDAVSVNDSGLVFYSTRYQFGLNITKISYAGFLTTSEYATPTLLSSTGARFSAIAPDGKVYTVSKRDGVVEDYLEQWTNGSVPVQDLNNSVYSSYFDDTTFVSAIVLIGNTRILIMNAYDGTITEYVFQGDFPDEPIEFTGWSLGTNTNLFSLAYTGTATDPFLFSSASVGKTVEFRVMVTTVGQASLLKIEATKDGNELRLCNNGDMMVLQTETKTILGTNSTSDRTISTAAALQLGECDVVPGEEYTLSANGRYLAKNNMDVRFNFINGGAFNYFCEESLGDCESAFVRYCGDVADPRCPCLGSNKAIVESLFPTSIDDLKRNTALYNSLLAVAPCLEPDCDAFLNEDNLVGASMRNLNCGPKNLTICSNIVFDSKNSAQFTRTECGVSIPCKAGCPVGSVCDEQLGACREYCTASIPCSNRNQSCSAEGVCQNIPETNSNVTDIVLLSVLLALVIGFAVWAGLRYKKK